MDDEAPLDHYRAKARRELRQHPVQVAIQMALVLGCPLLALYATRTYSPLDPTLRATWGVLAVVYAGFALGFFRHSSEGSAGHERRPGIRLIGVLGYPVVAVMGASGLIVLGNGMLDDSEPYALKSTVSSFFKPYTSRGRWVDHPNEVSVAISPPGPSPIWLKLSPDERRIVGIGSTIYLKVHKGAFGLPWYEAHTRPSAAPPTPRADGIPNLPPRITQYDDTILEPTKIPPHDPFGYPADLTDKRFVLKLARDGRFAELDRTLDSLERELDRDIRNEYRFWDAIQAFDQDDPALERSLDDWVTQRPRSAHARSARATYYVSRAWEARGTALANKMTDSETVRMFRFIQLAGRDASAALAIDPTHLAPYTVQFSFLMLQGGQAEARAVLARALRYRPASFILRERLSPLFDPRWGGNEGELEAFAADAAKDSARNPRLAALRGLVHDRRALDALRDRDYAAAVYEETQALTFGPERVFLMNRGEAYYEAQDWYRAMDDLERALQQRPQQLHLLRLHAMDLYYMSTGMRDINRHKALSKAIAEFELLQSIEPADSTHAEWLSFLHGAEQCTYQDRACRWRRGPDSM